MATLSRQLISIGLPIMVLVLLQFICVEAGSHAATREEEDEKQRETGTPTTEASEPEKMTTASTTPWQGREVSVDTSQVSLLIHKENVTLWMPLPHWLNEPLLPLWSVALMTFLGLGVAALLLCICCILVIKVTQYESDGPGMGQTLQTSLNPKHLYDDIDDESGDRLFREATLSLQLQWIYVVLAMAIACCLSSVPPWALAVAAPAVLRVSYLDIAHRPTAMYSVVDGSGATSSCSKLFSMASSAWEFTLSKLELVDAASDAIALATTVFLSDSVKTRFIDSFSSATTRAALASMGGLPGMAFIILLYSTIVQLCTTIITWSSNRSSSSASCADLAGLGLIAKKLMADVGEENSDWQAGRTFMAGVTRCFAEAAPQALLQSSILMVTNTELLEQPGLLASVMFSCITLLKNGISLARASVRFFSDMSGWPFAVVALVAAIAVFLILILILAKLYAVEACQSRIWGPATGCIPLAGPQMNGKNR